MTPAALRAEMAANIAELRTLPPCELADHARDITGYQDEQAVCWMCGAVRSVGDMRPAGTGQYACAAGHEDDCTDRSGRIAETEEAERIVFGSVL